MLMAAEPLRMFGFDLGRKNKLKPLPVIYMAGDAMIIFFIVSILMTSNIGVSTSAWHIAALFASTLVVLALSWCYGCYRTNSSWGAQFSCLITVWLQGIMAASLYLFIEADNVAVSIPIMLACCGTGLLMAILWRVLIVMAASGCSLRGVVARRFCIMGAGEKCSLLHERLLGDPSSRGIYRGRYFPYMEKHGSFESDGHSLCDLMEDIRNGKIDDVLWVPYGFSKTEMVAIESLSACNVKVYSVDDPDSPASHDGLYGNSHVIYEVKISTLWQALKDFIDRTAALLALIIIFPLLATVAAAIKIDSSGPIIFKQARGGINNKRFTIFKFRTMCKEAGLDKTVPQAQKNDRRITRIGKFLRTSSIDELPQLANVILGDMSFIGPRPHSVVHDERYMQLLPEYVRRMRVKPGLSGWAQVHGSRGYIDSIETMRHRVLLDNQYIDEWSFAKDIAIAFSTIMLVIKTTNAG